MFAFDRSAIAVLVPIALLLVVVVFSHQSGGHQVRAEAQATQQDQTVAANLPSR